MTSSVVEMKCLMSLNDHLLRPVGISPPYFSFTRFIMEQCPLKKDKYMTPAYSSKTTRSSHGAQYCRYQAYSDALKNYSLPPPSSKLEYSLSPPEDKEKFI